MSPNYMDFFLVSKGNLVCGPMPVQIKFFLGDCYFCTLYCYSHTIGAEITPPFFIIQLHACPNYMKRQTKN